MFDEQTGYEEEDYRGGPSVSSVIKIILGVFALVFFPSLIIAAITYYVLFKVLRWRPYISVAFVAFVELILVIIAKFTHPLSSLKLITDFSNNKLPVIGSYLYLCIMIGLLIGLIQVLARAWELRSHPELKLMKGWAHNYEYAPTPRELIQRKNNISALKSGDEYDTQRAPIGILDEEVINVDIESKENRNLASSIIYRYYTEARRHTLITGQTGSGKTVTMLSLIYNDILSGYPVCVIDFKKSPDLIYFLSRWAQENNREFYHFTSGRVGSYSNPFNDEQATYDPLSSGSATSKADMVLNLRTWDTSSEVFKKRTQDILQSVFYLLERTPHEAVPGVEWDNGGLAQFVSALRIDNLKAMIEIMNEDYMKGLLNDGDVRRLNSLLELYRELTVAKRSDLRDQINELVSICRTLIVSDYGDWLASGASNSHIDLLDIATDVDGPVVLFSFNEQEEADFARYIGSIVLSDLNRVSATKTARHDKNLFGVYIDEFQTLDPDSVTSSLEKARSANFFITLSLQSLDQIVKASSGDGEATVKSMLDTCSNFIFHDGSGYDTAERMSKIIGKVNQSKYQVNSKMTSGVFSLNWFNTRKGVVSKKDDVDWLIPPSEFQSLSSPSKSNNYKASAYVISKSVEDERFTRQAGALARKVHVVVNDDIAAGVPDAYKGLIKAPNARPLMHTELQQSTIADELIIPKEIVDGDWGIEEIEDVDELSIDEKIEDMFAEPTQTQTQQQPKMPTLNSLPPLGLNEKKTQEIEPIVETKKVTSYEQFKNKKKTKPQEKVSSLPKL